jgi:alpha-glucosidase
MIRAIFLIITLAIPCLLASQVIPALTSPDGRVELLLDINGQVNAGIRVSGKDVMRISGIGLQMDKLLIPADGIKKLKHFKKSLTEEIIPTIPQKKNKIPNHCNEITLTFTDGNQLVFRVYNEGVAYRFVTHSKKPLKVLSETASFVFSQEDSVWFPHMPDQDKKYPFHTSFELQYHFFPLSAIGPDSLAPAPVLVETSTGIHAAILESNLRDYPGMFLRGSRTANVLDLILPPCPLETEIIGDPYQSHYIKTPAGWIAETSGEKSFPWRVILLAEKDKDLLNNELVYCLADPPKEMDWSWIKPGQCMDNWIIDGILSGVDFKSGNNTESYKYYIDFAARYGIEYIMVEPVWSDLHDIFKPVPEMNMPELLRYAKEKRVDLWLWTEALALQKNMEAILDSFQLWGAAGFMVDFFNRNDQQTVQFFEKIAESAARHRLMLMYHGAFPNSGFERTWPNALTREAVAGSEYNKWAGWISPSHNLCLPFIRGLSGPFDYEPLVMPNATQESFRIIGSHPMTQTTRAGELAKYIIYASPLQVISGSPVDFERDSTIIRFLSEIPTTWDESIALDGAVGEFALLARRKGNSWYVAGMTNEKTRSMTIDLSFLPTGNYEATIVQDGLNADREAEDYRIVEQKVTKEDKLEIHCMGGGGFVMKIRSSIK